MTNVPVNAYTSRKTIAIERAQRIADAMQEERVVYENPSDGCFGHCSPLLFTAANAGRNDSGTAPLIFIQLCEPASPNAIEYRPNQMIVRRTCGDPDCNDPRHLYREHVRRTFDKTQ